MRIKKLFVFLLAAVLAMPVLNGCIKPRRQPIVVDKTISGDTIEYTFWAFGWDSYSQQPIANDKVLSKIEKDYNIKLKLRGASFNDWQTTLSTLIGSNEMPDIFFDFPDSYAFYNLVRQDAVLPISLYVDGDTPNLQKIYASQAVKSATFTTPNYGAQQYFYPNFNAKTNHALVYRKDWALAAGVDPDLTKPFMLGDLEAMLQAFTVKSGAGYSRNGMFASNIFGWLTDLIGSFGANPAWFQKADGTFEHTSMTPEYVNFLTWMKNAVDKGWINKDSLLMTEDEKLQKFQAGNAGMIFLNNGLSLDQAVASIVDAGGQVGVLPMPDNGSYKGGFREYAPYYGGWVINRNVKEPYRLIKLLDYFASQEGQFFRLNGIEGVHYEYDANHNMVISDANQANRLADGTEVVTPVVPVVVGDDWKAALLWRALYDAGVYVNVALHPAVPPAGALLRTSVMASHDRATLDRALDAFERVKRSFEAEHGALSGAA